MCDPAVAIPNNPTTSIIYVDCILRNNNNNIIN